MLASEADRARFDSAPPVLVPPQPSYGEDMEVGLIACRRTLPHMQRLLSYLEDALVELEELAGISQKAA